MTYSEMQVTQVTQKVFRPTAHCDFAGCGSFSWASTAEMFEARVAPTGDSLVKRCRIEGTWACRRHADDFGGWLT